MPAPYPTFSTRARAAGATLARKRPRVGSMRARIEGSDRSVSAISSRGGGPRKAPGRSGTRRLRGPSPARRESGPRTGGQELSVQQGQPEGAPSMPHPAAMGRGARIGERKGASARRAAASCRGVWGGEPLRAPAPRPSPLPRRLLATQGTSGPPAASRSRPRGCRRAPAPASALNADRGAAGDTRGLVKAAEVEPPGL